MENADKMLHLEMKINKVSADHIEAKEKWQNELRRIMDEYEKGGVSLEALERLILLNRREYNASLGKLIRRLDGYLRKYEELSNETESVLYDI